MSGPKVTTADCGQKLIDSLSSGDGWLQSGDLDDREMTQINVFARDRLRASIMVGVEAE